MLVIGYLSAYSWTQSTPVQASCWCYQKHMSWDHMIKSCAELHLCDPQREFLINGFSEMKPIQTANYLHSPLDSPATKKKHVDWNQFVWSYCGEKWGKTSYLGSLGSLFCLIGEGLIHPLLWLAVFWPSTAMDPSGDFLMVGRMSLQHLLNYSKRQQESPMSWWPCIQHHGPFVVLTPWKINMEHIHGGLEDYFPF